MTHGRLMDLKLTYDPETDAAYVRLGRGVVVDSEMVAPGVMLDYDEDGRLIGIEMRQARNRLPAETIKRAYQ